MTPGWAVSSTITPRTSVFWVAKRIGLGSTVNLGTWAGKLYYAFVGLVLVVCLAIGPIFGIVDSIPVRLELSGSTPVCLVASHGQSEKYRLDTDAITDVQLRDTLPDAARTWGTGMDHYLQGDFYVIGEGNARFCLDPHPKVFSPGGGRRAGVLVHRRFRGPHRRHCAGTAIHRSSLMQRPREPNFGSRSPFFLSFAPKRNQFAKNVTIFSSKTAFYH